MTLVPLFEATLNALPEPVACISADGLLFYANQPFKKMIGNLAIPTPAAAIWPEWEGSHPLNQEVVSHFMLAEGGTIPVKIAVLVCMPDGTQAIRVLAVGPKNDAWHAFHSQRLETLGLLSGGIAHDFNNMLTGILGHVTYLKTILPGAGTHLDSLTAIEHGARKASGITQQILNFSRLEQTDGPHKLDINNVISRTCNLLRGAIPPGKYLKYKTDGEPVWVSGVEGKIAQVLVNLVINARDALGESGNIEVVVEQEPDNARIQRALGTTEVLNPYVRISVIDDGEGMSPEVQTKIFDPFFSTKKSKGTGLGLTTVLAIINELQGGLEILSEVGKGTSMSVFLPIVSEADSAEDEEGPLVGGDERILVVDDEYPVRQVLGVSLEHLGYEVELAASGQEALEKYADEPFDLVLLDMLMPQMSGEQVFRELKAINPNVKVLIMSGYTSEETLQTVLKSGALGFIPKPFTIQELAKIVRESL